MTTCCKLAVGRIQLQRKHSEMTTDDGDANDTGVALPDSEAWKIPKLCIYVALFLISWGLGTSIIVESKSMTSFIPAFFGVPIGLMGLFCFWFAEQRKIWMHVAALFGLITALAGLDIFRSLASDSNPFDNPVAAVSKLMLLIVGVWFSFVMASSFAKARALSRAKDATTD